MEAWKHWRLETDGDDIAWLHFDRQGAGTNVFDHETLDELDRALDDIRGRNPRGLVILSAKPNGFIAGADIGGFQRVESREQALDFIRKGQRVFRKLEALRFPTLALIHGFCLGGGLEMALACDYRIARDDPGTRLGLPEVRLGIHPGFGGSVRLPPLIGAPAAMDLMLTGRSIAGFQARKLGLVDHAVPERHLREAARQTVLARPPRHRPRWYLAATNSAPVRPLLAPLMRRRVAAKAPPEHYPAPYALIDLWRRHGGDARAMMAAEAESVADLIMGATAQNLVRVFFLQERLKSLGKASDFRVEHVHVVGAGVMGGDIAAWCALRGFTVSLQDQSPERIAPAVGRAWKLFQQKLKRRHLARAAMDRLIPDHKGLYVEKADVVIKAIFEDRDAKRSLYRSLEPRLKPDALLCTNTSSIPLEELAGALAEPARLVGLHFFNPVAKMQLVEVVRGRSSGDTAIAHAQAFTRAIDRLPLPVASSPGFLVNRILMPYLLEAVILESEGVPAPVIDRAARDFGMPMGPIELADTVGLDICLHVGRILAEELGGEVPERLQRMVDAGHLGRKSGSGFYEYRKGKPVKSKVESGYRPPEDLTDRLILRMLNEAVTCLREGVVEDADLLDAGMIFGTGFAPFRGGPLHYIHEQGMDTVRSRLEALEARHGARFRPDPGWTSLAEGD